MDRSNETESGNAHEQRDADAAVAPVKYDKQRNQHATLTNTQPTLTLQAMQPNQILADFPGKPGPKITIDPDKAERIVELLARGETLDSIAEKTGTAFTTIYRWRRASEEFDRQCACAREIAAEYDYDKVCGIERKIADGELAPDAGRVILNSMTWRMSRMYRKLFGDKQVIEHDISDGLAKRMEQAEQRRLQAGSGSKMSSATIIDAQTGKPE